jgi:hypothetical protein
MLKYDPASVNPPSGSIVPFDVSLPPELHHLDPLLKLSATNPPLASIVIEYPALPWPVVVQSWKYDHSSVTIGDVLWEIYENLQLPLDSPDRCETILFAKESTLTRGRRIDYLEDNCRFLGLSSSDIGDDTWVLHVSRA